MQFSTHYYVLSLSTTMGALFEAFRDSLIDVQNQGFPILGQAAESDPGEEGQRFLLARTVDEHFGHYYARDPLKLVVVGAPEMQAAFSSVTAHGTAVIGRIEGDHTATSARDLGQIVWPVVKEAMSGVLHRAMRDLEECAAQGRLAAGLDAVVRAASEEMEATLLVEADYHRRGSIWRVNHAPRTTRDVDVRDTTDDVVDAVIDSVLASSGNVVFTPPGTLRGQQRIVMLMRRARDL